MAAVALALPASAFAAPANDSYMSPQGMSLGFGYSGDNTGAGTFTGEPLTDKGSGGCDDGSKMGSTVWYRFTGTGRPVELFTYNTDPAIDTVLAVYERSPTNANLIACNNDDPAVPTSESDLSFDSAVGQEYLVQVGGLDTAADPPQEGAFQVAGLSFPSSDERTNAESFGAGPPFVGDNRGAVTDNGEDVVCEADNNAPLDKTVWTKFQVGEEGDASLTASGFDTVMQIYRAGDAAPFACNDDGRTGTAGPSRLSVRLTPGEYFVQVGGYGSGDEAKDGDLTLQLNFTVDTDLDKDGSNRPQDCNDRNPGIRPGATDIPDNNIDEDCNGVDAHNLDRDGDGYNTPLDCNDANAGINPGASDTPADGVDQNCNGVDDPARLIGAGYDWELATNGLTIKRLVAVRVLPGMQIQLSSGGKRAFKKRNVAVKKAGQVDLRALLKKKERTRPNGSTLVLRITQPGTIGKILTLTFRRNKRANADQRCLTANTNKKMKCPSA